MLFAYKGFSSLFVDSVTMAVRTNHPVHIVTFNLTLPVRTAAPVHSPLEVRDDSLIHLLGLMGILL
ncbi:hypothetical protein ES703_46330 [subsurface metagenome]